MSGTMKSANDRHRGIERTKSLRNYWSLRRNERYRGNKWAIKLRRRLSSGKDRHFIANARNGVISRMISLVRVADMRTALNIYRTASRSLKPVLPNRRKSRKANSVSFSFVSTYPNMLLTYTTKTSDSAKQQPGIARMLSRKSCYMPQSSNKYACFLGNAFCSFLVVVARGR